MRDHGRQGARLSRSDGPVWLHRVSRPTAVLGLGVAVVSLIRAWGVTHGDLVLFDEGFALVQGHDLVHVLTHPTRVPAQYRLPNNGKVLYDLLAGALLRAGASPFDVVWINVVSGTLMVAAVTGLMYRRLGTVAGITALLMAGLVPISIMYSHRMLAEAAPSAVLALLLIAVAHALDSSSSSPSRRIALVALVLSALIVGLNYRYAPIAVPLLTVVVLQPMLRRRWGRATACAIMLLPGPALAATNVALRLAGVQSRDIIGGWPFANLDFYPRLLDQWSNLVFAALLIAGLAACWIGRRRLDLFTVVVIAGLVGQVVLVSVAGAKAPRALYGMVPLAAIVAARAFQLIPESSTGWRTRGVAGASILAVWSGIAGSGEARVVSAVQPLAVWLSNHPGNVADDRLFTMALIDPGQQSDPLTDVASVSALRARGDRWAIVDAQNWAVGYPATTFAPGAYGPPEIVAQLLACGTPAARFDDPGGWSDYFFLEGADANRRSYENALSWLAAGRRATHGQLIVFDLQQGPRCHVAPSLPGAPSAEP